MKTAKEIYDKMQQVYLEHTGFSSADSSDVSVRLYAAAAQLESLYGYCDWSLRQSFPQTATGEYLDLHAGLRALQRQEASPASGQLQFSLNAPQIQDVPVEAGTVCASPGGVRFVTTEPAYIPAGQVQCLAPAVAEEAGTAGNTAANTVTEMTRCPAGISACTNPAPFTGGKDAESDDALRLRILASYRRLPNGANAAFYEQRVRSHSGVCGVEVIPRKRGAGTVDIFVSVRDGIPDPALLEEIRQDLAQLREISVDLEISAPTPAPVDMEITLWPADGVGFEDAKSTVVSALTEFFSGELLAKPVFLVQLGNVLYATGKVKNFTFTAPAADIAAQSGILPTLGSLVLLEGA